MISDSVEKVDTGNRLVAQAGSAMEEIVSSVQRVTDIISEIVMASQEQASGINQVNVAITHLDETTQQNSALVEQAAAAAEPQRASAIAGCRDGRLQAGSAETGADDGLAGTTHDGGNATTQCRETGLM